MDNHTIPTENKMGTMPIPKLLISMSVPMILSMLVQALYNIVDSIFVAQLITEGKQHALTAVSLAFPIQSLMIAVAGGTGVGVNALLSKSLGEKKIKEASDIAKNGILLAIISSLVFAVFGIFGSRFFFMVQTKNEHIIRYGTEYMTIITVVSIGIFLQITFERLLQSTGKTFYNMITQGVGAIVNIILDPILIFGYFGLPRMEVVGAALATVIGQIVALLLGLYFNIKKNKEIDIMPKGFRPGKRIIGSIYKIGVPSIIMQSIGSIMYFCMSKILLAFSETEIAATVFGVYFKLQSFVFMPVFGLTNGVIPIVAYNYGARNRKRIIKTIFLGGIIAVGIMAAGFVVFQFCPDTLLMMFKATAEMKEIGIPALRIISFSFIMAGFAIVISASFQALGNGVYSLIISVIRQLMVLLPAAWIFAYFVGLKSVWWAFPIAEVVALTLCLLFLKRIYNEKIKHL